MLSKKKKCFKCGKNKLRTSFYSHSGTSDGLLGKCKDCTKKDVRAHSRKPENREKLKKASRIRRLRISKETKRKLQQASRRKFPGKYRARWKLENAIKTGKIVKRACEKCGSKKSQGHHRAYRKALEVIWLCDIHHKEEHRKYKE